MTRRWTWCCAGVGCTLFFVRPDFQMFHSFILIGLFPNKLVKFYRSYWLSIRAFCRLHFFRSPNFRIFIDSSAAHRIVALCNGISTRWQLQQQQQQIFASFALFFHLFSHIFRISSSFPAIFYHYPLSFSCYTIPNGHARGKAEKTIAPWQILAERVHNLCGPKRIRS